MSALGAAFENARAPRRWRRGIAAAPSRLRTTLIRAAWTSGFVRPLPELCSGPLFGTALADAVRRLGASTREQDETPPAHRGDRTSNPPSLGRAPVRDSSPHANGPWSWWPSPQGAVRSRTPVAGTHEFEVAGRRAGSSPATAAMTRAGSGDATPATLRAQVRSAPESLLTRLGAADGREDSGTAQLRRSPGSTFARRSASPGAFEANGTGKASSGSFERLARTVMTAPDATGTLRARIVERAHASHASGGRPRSEALVERDWARSPLGPVAPHSLLQRITGMRNAQPRGPAAGRYPTRRPVTSPHAESRDEIAQETGDAAPAGTPERMRRTATAAPPSGAASPANPAPPFAIPSEGLPAAPFAWPRSGAEPAMVFAAAPAAAREAELPRDADDDLDLLSAKLGRILVAQARRHGIDV